ncbi:tetratricopeptide repeat protein [Pseudoalteromonas sp. J010]|uniref:TPR end-of-group domain-containing protein n=1 Tax=Pseudoalteromonas sp. J010 TaxID=998465 RepID=UPI000F651D92|nr:tetratricopeptide repeat protein [Pseudoalteromonas sp. J010]RRS09357.1 tetratricopeptide repeat protein [Pseudoalteromonas sp. J010]
MKSIVLFIFLAAFSLTSSASEPPSQNKPSENQQQQALSQLQEPMYRPLIERYILDELKAVREDQMRLRADIEKKISHSQLDTADRAITYTTDTINNVLFLITAAASILVVVGWSSFRDIKSKVEDIVSQRVGTITDEYEKRLQVLEEKLRERSEEILNNQKKISITNEVHSLWMRANLESDMNSKIEIYDEILNRKPEDVEAIAYKADALLELGQTNTAIDLCNQALEIDSDYGYAYWQRACAYAMLYQHADAMADIRMALEYAPNLKNELQHEPAFASLADNQSFNELVNS